MDYNSMNNVNKRILELCRQRKWTEYRLAKETKIPTSSINAMFNHNHTPTIHNLQKICDALHISLSQFFSSDLFQKNEDTDLYIDLWNKLHISDQEKVLIYIYGLLRQIPKNKKEDKEDKNDI